jgi:hypothetical protein
LVARPEDLGVGDRIILKLILGKLGLEVWVAFVWLRIGIAGG